MGNSDYISRIMLVFNMTGERGVGKRGGGGVGGPLLLTVGHHLG